jgi:hypothetical protein
MTEGIPTRWAFTSFLTNLSMILKATSSVQTALTKREVIMMTTTSTIPRVTNPATLREVKAMKAVRTISPESTRLTPPSRSRPSTEAIITLTTSTNAPIIETRDLLTKVIKLLGKTMMLSWLPSRRLEEVAVPFLTKPVLDLPRTTRHLYLQEVVVVEAEVVTLVTKTDTTPNIKTNQLKSKKICLTPTLDHLMIDIRNLPRDIKADLTFQLTRNNSPSQKKKTRETAFSFERLDRMERRRRRT